MARGSVPPASVMAVSLQLLLAVLPLLLQLLRRATPLFGRLPTSTGEALLRVRAIVLLLSRSVRDRIVITGRSERRPQFGSCSLLFGAVVCVFVVVPVVVRAIVRRVRAA